MTSLVILCERSTRNAAKCARSSQYNRLEIYPRIAKRPRVNAAATPVRAQLTACVMVSLYCSSWSQLRRVGEEGQTVVFTVLIVFEGIHRLSSGSFLDLIWIWIWIWMMQMGGSSSSSNTSTRPGMQPLHKCPESTGTLSRKQWKLADTKNCPSCGDGVPHPSIKARDKALWTWQ